MGDLQGIGGDFVKESSVMSPQASRIQEESMSQTPE
jgi:hypothetical protein